MAISYTLEIATPISTAEVARAVHEVGQLVFPSISDSGPVMWSEVGAGT